MSMINPTTKLERVLIDADSLLYIAAFGATLKDVKYGEDDKPSDIVNADLCRGILDERRKLWETAAFDGGLELPVTYVLTDKSCKSFRHHVYPDYKANRKTPLPELYQIARAHLADTVGEKCIIIRGLEADDVVSMLAHESDRRSVIVSIDKDLLQVPGYHVTPKLTLEESKRFYVGEESCAKRLWHQVLTGDTSDNYKGAPGVGQKKADEVIGHCHGISKYIYWPEIIKVYAHQFGKESWKKKFVTESPYAEATLNYRMARLLKPGDYKLVGETAFVRLDAPDSGNYTEIGYPLDGKDTTDTATNDGPGGNKAEPLHQV